MSTDIKKKSAKPGAEPEFLAGGELPEIGELFSETLNDFTGKIGPYALAGVGLMLAALPVVLVSIFVLYAVLGVGFFLFFAVIGTAMAFLPEELAALSGLLSVVIAVLLMFVAIFGFTGFIGALLAPVNASLMRAVAAQQRDGTELTFGAAFSTMTQNLGAVIGGAILYTTIMFLALMACYVPFFLVLILLGFTYPLIALHNMGAFSGMSTAYKHSRQHMGWHAKFALTYFGITLVASQVPIVGAMFAVSFHVRAYRKVFGDGDEPRLAFE